MLYWTSKRSGVSIRFRAYRLRDITDNYSILARKPLAEVYVFLHKEHHGSCIGIIKGEGMIHYESKESAFTTISEELNKKEIKV
tara:strand:+ start:1556 stop:1807 length:252 start_codon:yes stop_codon:yes gene_type:complete